MPRLTRAVPVSGELGVTSAVDTSKTSWDEHVLAFHGMSSQASGGSADWL
jgi:hypothetical protein